MESMEAANQEECGCNGASQDGSAVKSDGLFCQGGERRNIGVAGTDTSSVSGGMY